MSSAFRSLCLSSFLFLALGGCSPKPAASCSETCSGCCDSANVCQPGNVNSACGLSGFMCLTCQSDTTCSFGSCVVTSSSGGGAGGGGGKTDGGTGGGATGGSGGGSTGGGAGTGGGVATGGGSGTGGGGSTGTDGGTPPIDGGTCAGTLAACGNQCIDTLASVENCGRCGNVCGNGQVCINGSCRLLPDDCTVAECGSGFFCDPVTRKCATGCRLSTDCPSGATCNTGVCNCPTAQHACGQRCVTNTAINSCGANSCMSCGAPANATPTCDGTNCGFACNSGFTAQGSSCVDVNECLTANGGCAPDATCTNTPGSRTCTCNAGYTGNGITCVDVNECLTANGGCHPSATCNNTLGGRTCMCLTGFTGDGITSCVDVNECSTNNGNCGSGATCANLDGGYTCGCSAGYAVMGGSCVDINECLTSNGGCLANLATCTNTPGSRTCACNAGYTGDGVSTCTDVNECLTNNGGCSTNATCTNDMPGRTCTCNSGFSGNGLICTQGSATFALVRVGTGAVALTNAATETHLELRNLGTGALLTDITLPTAASGGNSPFTLSGVATAEGMLNVSSDNAYYVLAGYAAVPGVPGVSTSDAGVPRVIGRVSIGSSTINTTTIVGDSYGGSSFRTAASTNGNGYWVAGASSGVRYVVQGSTGASTDVANTRSNLRATEIINGQLYATTGANPNTDGGTELSRIFSVGTGLPMSSTSTYGNFPGVVSINPSNFVLLDRSTIINGPDTIYLAETSSTSAVRKYEFNGATWNETATFPISSGTAYFMAAFADASSVTLLVSSSAGVLVWNDTGVTGVGPAPVVLVPQATNTAFRGIAVAP